MCVEATDAIPAKDNHFACFWATPPACRVRSNTIQYNIIQWLTGSAVIGGMEGGGIAYSKKLFEGR